MRLITYIAGDQYRGAIEIDGWAFDLQTAAVGAELPGAAVLTSNLALLRAGSDAQARVLDWARAAAAGAPDAGLGRTDELTLGPPITDPDKIICLGANYLDHAREAQMDLPAVPMLFAKFRNALIGSGAPVVLPPSSSQVDYEAELAVVIGRRCKNVPAERAIDHVAGAMPLNDISARDLQKQTSQWLAGKAVDTFAPCGPALVTMADILDLQSLDISARVNGVELQRSNTSQMIFSVAETIAFISALITLEPGDIIATGTPAGVGITRNPPVLLAVGDVVDVTVEGLGTLSNPVAGRPAMRP